MKDLFDPASPPTRYSNPSAVKIPERPGKRWPRFTTGKAIATFFRMTRVLLVEDCSDVLYILQLELNWMGYTVDTATNAEEAIELASKNGPDVIVSDLHMPGTDGFEFIRRVRGITGMANVPAIALTGFSRDKDVQRALASGFTAHLIKPVEAAVLATRIDQLTNQRLQKRAS
jgi:two-component system CheB/CheR fusion protein